MAIPPAAGLWQRVCRETRLSAAYMPHRIYLSCAASVSVPAVVSPRRLIFAVRAGVRDYRASPSSCSVASMTTHGQTQAVWRRKRTLNPARHFVCVTTSAREFKVVGPTFVAGAAASEARQVSSRHEWSMHFSARPDDVQAPLRPDGTARTSMQRHAPSAGMASHSHSPPASHSKKYEVDIVSNWGLSEFFP